MIGATSKVANLSAGALEEHPGFQELSLEINRLKEKTTDTPDLYREVCALLFFRYGVTPTANKLYQLVRRGSMSAPSEALRRFWENLREKSRIRIDHPDLPPELAGAAAELIATLWHRAQAQADSGYAAARQETQALALAAQEQVRAAEARAESAAQALFQLQAEFSANLTRLQELDRALAVKQGDCARLQQEVAAQTALGKALQEARLQARKDFEAQLEAQKRAGDAAEETHRLEAERLRAEGAQERSAAAVAQRDLAVCQEAMRAQDRRHSEETGALQRENARLGEELAFSRATATQARAANETLRRQLDKALQRPKPGLFARRGKLAHRTLA
jgi:chromosome segregation ATPase